MLLGSKKDKDTDARVRPASGITDTGGHTEGPEQQVQGWWELYPNGSRDGGEPRAGGPTSASPRV